MLTVFAGTKLTNPMTEMEKKSESENCGGDTFPAIGCIINTKPDKKLKHEHSSCAA